MNRAQFNRTLTAYTVAEDNSRSAVQAHVNGCNDCVVDANNRRKLCAEAETLHAAFVTANAARQAWWGRHPQIKAARTRG